MAGCCEHAEIRQVNLQEVLHGPCCLALHELSWLLRVYHLCYSLFLVPWCSKSPVKANVIRRRPHGHSALEIYEDAAHQYDELEYVAQYLQGMHQKGVPWKMMAVFFRRNREVRW